MKQGLRILVLIGAGLVAGLIPAGAQAQLVNQTTSGAWSLTVPPNTYFVSVTMSGGGGGGGGADTNGNGGAGGAGANLNVVMAVSPGDQLSGTVAAGGVGGISQRDRTKYCSGGGAGGSGGAAGGSGGNQNCGLGNGISGGGGGGGGSTTLLINGAIVLQAGGGGGGGGGSYYFGGTANANPNGGAATLGTAACSALAGGVGANTPGDGGGGGGGGAGSTAGAGGSYGADWIPLIAGQSATGGAGGGSCAVNTTGNALAGLSSGTGSAGGNGATNTGINGANGTAGKIVITALPSLMLRKTWAINSSASDSISVATTGGVNAASVAATGSTAGSTTSGTRVYQNSGNTINFPTETFTPAASASNYRTTLACTGNTNAVTGSGGWALQLTAADTNVVCTYTNTPSKANLFITKTNNASSVVSNVTTDYTIVVTNNGPADASGATFTDVPSTGLNGCSIINSQPSAAGVSAPAIGSTIASPGGSSFTLGNFPSGASVTITVRCTVK